MIEQAVEQARKQLEDSGFKGKELEELLKKVRKQVEEQIKKNGNSSFPQQNNFSPVFFQDENKHTKEKKIPGKEENHSLLEDALKAIEKDLRSQGFQGEELNALLKEARIHLKKQIAEKKIKAPVKKKSKEAMQAMHKQAMAQIKKEYEAQGFFGKILKKMLENTSKKIRQQIKGDPYAIDDRAFLGITLKEVVEGEGVSVTPQNGKAAHRAGMKDGDRIVKFNNRVIHSPNDIIAAIQGMIPGDIVQLKVKRDNSNRYFSFALDGPNGPVAPSKEQLKSRFNSPLERMVENALSKVKSQLKPLKLSKENFEKILNGTEIKIREEVSKRLETK